MTGDEYYTPGTCTVEDSGGVLHTRHIHSRRWGGVQHTRYMHSRRHGRFTTHQAHIQWKTGEEYYTPDTYTVEEGEEYYTPGTCTVEDMGGVLHTRHIHSGRQGRSTTHQTHTQ